MNPHFIFDAILKDLRRRSRDPAALLLWVGIPLLVGGLMILTLGDGGNTRPTARLVVFDQDDSLLSRLLGSAFQQGPLAEMIELKKVEDETVGLEQVREGASGLLVIPQGFSDAVLGKRQVDLRLIENPSQRILPRILEETLDLFVDMVFYGNQLLGPELREVTQMAKTSGAPELTRVTALSEAVYQRISAANELISPPLLSLEVVSQEPDAEGAQQESVPVALFFFPGVLLMGVLFASQGMSEDLWHEKEKGTLRRQLASPAVSRDILLAKLLASGLIVAITTGIVLVLGCPFLGLTLRKIPFALLWLGLSGLAFSSLMFSIQLLMPSKRAGMLLTSFLIFPLMMAGGSFFPFETMPTWMAQLGRWTPNGMLLEQLKAFLLDRAGSGQLALGVVTLLLFTAILGGLASLRLRQFAKGGG